MPRITTFTADAPATKQTEVARILAYYITGGDPVGYLAQITQRIKQTEGRQAQ